MFPTVSRRGETQEAPPSPLAVFAADPRALVRGEPLWLGGFP